MPAAVADDRVLWKVAATATVVLKDQDGEPVDAAGTVTVDIAKADGTTVATARSTSHGATGIYTVAITATETASLDLFTLTWKDTAVARAVTHVEIVGGYFFTLAQARATEPSIAGLPDATLKEYRRAVEVEAEKIAGCAFVPRYRRTVVKSTGVQELVLPDPLPRAVREVSPALQGAYSSTDIAQMTLREYGVIEMATNWFPQGMITVGYEHGYDRPPEPVRKMAIRRLRYLVNLAKSPTSDRQARLVLDTETGRTLQYASAGAYRTGDDEVDAVYWRHGFRALALG